MQTLPLIHCPNCGEPTVTAIQYLSERTPVLYYATCHNRNCFMRGHTLSERDPADFATRDISKYRPARAG